MNARFTLSTTLALSLLVTPAVAQTSQAVAKVAQAINGYPQLTIFDHVDVRIENGEAVVTGKVTMPFKKEGIERRIAKAAGLPVRNEIQVLPVSPFDDELRRRVARAIYGNSAFWRYASMSTPPIHIIVEHGRVTLAGVVNNNVERALAQSLASGLGESSLTNLLQTDREPERDGN